MFDLDGAENLGDNPANPYWSLINKKVIGKFKFEVLGIGEICASAPKMNSILIVKNDKL